MHKLYEGKVEKSCKTDIQVEVDDGKKDKNYDKTRAF